MKKVVFVFALAWFTINCFAEAILPKAAQSQTERRFSFLSGKLSAYTAYQDIRFKTLDGKVILSDAEIKTLTFNRLTVWNAQNQGKAEEVLNTYANPGLGVRNLHSRGITGKGVVVAIIDQNLAGEHPEFRGKIREYHDLGCDQGEDFGSMHGPAVTSLLVGNAIGTAPDCIVYYFAAPSWKADSKYYADALNMILDINENRAENEKIKVVSVSAAPSGNGSPFKKNTNLWDAAVKKAMDANVLILDCTQTYGFISPGYYDSDSPEDIALFKSGFPGRKGWGRSENNVCAPCSCRTVAEEYGKGEYSYQYTGVGGLSWGIPYVAGVCALAWQINPDISARQMKQLVLDSAYVTRENVRVINPEGLVAMVSAHKQ